MFTLAKRSLVNLKSVRFASSTTETTTTPVVSSSSAVDVANRIVNMFPGQTTATKSGSLLAALSLSAYMISKEVYVLDVETFEMIALFGAYYIWYSGGTKQGVIDHVNEKNAVVKNVLQKARDDHKSLVHERIQHLAKMDDIVPTTNSLYDMSTEVAEMEAKVYALKQKVQFKSEIKATLDGWVRYEANLREQEQKKLAAQVIGKVTAALLDPKLQANILSQTLLDFDRVSSSAKTA